MNFEYLWQLRQIQTSRDAISILRDSNKVEVIKELCNDDQCISFSAAAEKMFCNLYRKITLNQLIWSEFRTEIFSRLSLDYHELVHLEYLPEHQFQGMSECFADMLEDLEDLQLSTNDPAHSTKDHAQQKQKVIKKLGKMRKNQMWFSKWGVGRNLSRHYNILTQTKSVSQADLTSFLHSLADTRFCSQSNSGVDVHELIRQVFPSIQSSKISKSDCRLCVEMFLNIQLLFEHLKEVLLKGQELDARCLRGFMMLILDLKKSSNQLGSSGSEDEFVDDVKDLVNWYCDDLVRKEKFNRSLCEMADQGKGASIDIIDQFVKWRVDEDWLQTLRLHKFIAKRFRKFGEISVAPFNVQENSVSLVGFISELQQFISGRFIKRQPIHENPSANQCKDKFISIELDDTIQCFHNGLESRIGYPATISVLSVMQREHLDDRPFHRSSGNVINLEDDAVDTICPCDEWNIVMRGSESHDAVTSGGREIVRNLDFYFLESERIFNVKTGNENKELLQKLTKEEVAALRLWTGPMYKRYVYFFRHDDDVKCYPTTMHAINSGIVKLSKVWKVPSCRKVYRGYKDAILEDRFLLKDSFGCSGGVERSVLATTEDWDTAVLYTRDKNVPISQGNSGLIFEIEVGQVDRGADISWLSQFPHEKEILFGALSNLEIVGKPHRCFIGTETVLVVPVRINVNLKNKTLEEFQSLRRTLHQEFINHLLAEMERCFVDDIKENSSSLVNIGAKISLKYRDHMQKIHQEPSIKESDSAGIVDSIYTFKLSSLQKVLTACKKRLHHLLGKAGNEIFNSWTSYEKVIRETGYIKSKTEALIKFVNLDFPWEDFLLSREVVFAQGMLRPSQFSAIELLNHIGLQLSEHSLGMARGVRQVRLKKMTREFPQGIFSKKITLVVDADNQEANDNILMILSLNPGLKDLSLRSMAGKSWLTLSGILLYCTNLRDLDLCNNNMDNSTVKVLNAALATLSSLRTLSVRKNKLCADGTASICAILKTHTDLQSLDLRLKSQLKANEIKMGPQGGQALAKTAQLWAHLQVLNLGNNHIKDSMGVDVIQSLSLLTSLQLLNLRGNKLKINTAEALAKTLRSLFRLHTLNLGNNGFCCAGILAISQAFEVLESLTFLDFGYNKIGRGDIKAFSTCIVLLTTLRVLHLGNNDLGYFNSKAVANSLATLTSLSVVSIQKNGMNRVGIVEIEACLTHVEDLKV